MHQITASRKAIYIPHSVDVIPLEELASRLAATVKPLNESSNDAEWYEHRSLSKVLLHGFAKACEAGRLLVRDPIAHMPCHHETKGAVVLVDDAASYLAESGSRFRITRYAEALPFVGLHPDELVPLDDVPMLVANAMHDPETDSEWHGFQRLVIEKRIYEAANFGGLAMLDHLTRQRLSIRSTGACSTAGELCAFFCNPSAPAEKGPPALAPAPVTCPVQVTYLGHTDQPLLGMTPEEEEEAAAWADAVNKAEGQEQVERQNWVVTKYERDTAYRPALHRYLLSEWQKGRLRKPTARDVIEAWRANKPQGIYEVMQDGVKYIDNSGNIKELSLAALKAAIGRITKVHA